METGGILASSGSVTALVGVTKTLGSLVTKVFMTVLLGVKVCRIKGVHVCTQPCMYVCVCACACVHMFVCMYLLVYICDECVEVYTYVANRLLMSVCNVPKFRSVCMLRYLSTLTGVSIYTY